MILNLEELKQIYVTNERRTYLYGLLLKEIKNLKRHCSSLLILIYGSFITNKELPGDIDLLVHLYLNKEGLKIRLQKGTIQQFPKDIHIKGNINPSVENKDLISAKELIINFNNLEENKCKNIKISQYIILDL